MPGPVHGQSACIWKRIKRVPIPVTSLWLKRIVFLMALMFQHLPIDRGVILASNKATKFDLIKAVAANSQILKADPRLNLFLLRYLNKFQPIKIGDRVIVHSHLPPLNSKAYSRFIDEHLLSRSSGPSHAQIGLTNACPQNCQYCYNKGRSGRLMDRAVITGLIKDLKRMGVFWLGFTGGEPLLNRDIVSFVETAGEECATKLFTTGCTLSRSLAADLVNAGLNYVSVSLDHWKPEIHDSMRRYEGAFKAAVTALDTFRSFDRLHVGVSAVLSREMIRTGQVDEFLQFLIGLDIHEAWLSEAKPAVAAFAQEDQVITEADRLALVRLQDRYNAEGKITVNYLGHFEGKECFGCNAGNKMVYVDAFGQVSPCVFVPMTFGNVMEQPVETIFAGMKQRFPTENGCFINKNYRLLAGKSLPLAGSDAMAVLDQVQFGDLARFNQIYNKR